MVPTYHLMQKMKEAIKKLRESLAGEDGIFRFLLFILHRSRGSGLGFDWFFLVWKPRWVRLRLAIKVAVEPYSDCNNQSSNRAWRDLRISYILTKQLPIWRPIFYQTITRYSFLSPALNKYLIFESFSISCFLVCQRFWLVVRKRMVEKGEDV